MKIILMFIVLFFLTNCAKNNTVFICGDHICVNKDEANQYFQENLTIEVKINQKEDDKKLDLVELNMRTSQKDEKKVGIFKKQQTNYKLKTLTNAEKKEIKNKVKKIKQVRKLSKKIDKNNNKVLNFSEIENRKTKKNKLIFKNQNNNKEIVKDVCALIEKCNIDGISKYLLNQSKKKDFPDITTRK